MLTLLIKKALNEPDYGNVNLMKLSMEDKLYIIDEIYKLRHAHNRIDYYELIFRITYCLESMIREGKSTGDLEIDLAKSIELGERSLIEPNVEIFGRVFGPSKQYIATL